MATSIVEIWYQQNVYVDWTMFMTGEVSVDIWNKTRYFSQMMSPGVGTMGCGLATAFNGDVWVVC